MILKLLGVHAHIDLCVRSQVCVGVVRDIWWHLSQMDSPVFSPESTDLGGKNQIIVAD